MLHKKQSKCRKQQFIAIATTKIDFVKIATAQDKNLSLKSLDKPSNFKLQKGFLVESKDKILGSNLITS